MITKNTEKILITRYREEKDIDSLFLLLNNGINLVFKIASRYPGDLNHHLLVGISGWRQALEKYDLSKNYSFSIYSTFFIKKAIEDTLV